MNKLLNDNNFIELNGKLRNQLSRLTTEDRASFDDISHCTKAIQCLRRVRDAEYPEENYPLVESLLIKINKNEHISFAEIMVLLISILNLRELPKVII